MTGSSGFIGGYVTELAREEGYEVCCAVRRESACRADRPDTECVMVDYSSAETLRHQLRSIERCSYVIHCAGITKALSADQFAEVNGENTRRLLEALDTDDLRPDRFLLLSSMGSYGRSGAEGRLTGDMPQQPDTAYGYSKWLAERYLIRSSVPWTILCPTGVYGFGDKDYLISLRGMQRGWSLCSGTTPQRLSFVYVRDVAAAILFLLTHPEAEGHRYLLSDGRDYTDDDYTRIVSELLGRHVRTVRVPIPLIRLACNVGDFHGHLSRHPVVLNKDKFAILSRRSWLCDISPLLELGFTPRYDLRDGLEETLRLLGMI